MTDPTGIGDVWTNVSNKMKEISRRHRSCGGLAWFENGDRSEQTRLATGDINCSDAAVWPSIATQLSMEHSEMTTSLPPCLPVCELNTSYSTFFVLIRHAISDHCVCKM